MKKEIILQDLQKRHPNEPEFLQAVQEVLTSVEDVYNEPRGTRPHSDLSRALGR